MDIPKIAFGAGFSNKTRFAKKKQCLSESNPLYMVDPSNGMPIISEKKANKTQVSKIGGKKIKEKRGKLTADLGKPPSKVSKGELESYIKAAKTPAEKRKRQARVNLARAHMKGTKAVHGKAPKIPAAKGGEKK